VEDREATYERVSIRLNDAAHEATVGGPFVATVREVRLSLCHRWLASREIASGAGLLVVAISVFRSAMRYWDHAGVRF